MSEYLQPDIDPSALGFLSIFLGGSIIHKTNLAEASIRDVDWDGVGFVPRKTDIISLLRERRADLCDLLGVVEEDGSTASWEVGYLVKSFKGLKLNILTGSSGVGSYFRLASFALLWMDTLGFQTDFEDMVSRAPRCCGFLSRIQLPRRLVTQDVAHDTAQSGCTRSGDSSLPPRPGY